MRFARRFVAVALLAGLPSCRGAVVATGERPAAEPDAQGRASAAAFFRSPLLSHLSLSPDGRQIAAIHERDGLEMVIVRAASGGAIRPLAKLERRASAPSRQIRALGWPSNDRVVVSIEQPAQGTRRSVDARETRLLVVPLDGSGPAYLGEKWRYHLYSQIQDRIISWLPRDPESLLLNWQAPDERAVSAARVNVRNGTMRMEALPLPDSTHWFADGMGRVRAVAGASRRGTMLSLYARAGDDLDFERISYHDAFGDPGLEFAGFSEVPEEIYVWSSAATGRRALHRYDLRSGSLGDAVFSHPEVDGAGTLHAPDDRLLAVLYAADRPRALFVDAAEQERFAALDRATRGSSHRMVSRDADDRRAIFVASGDTAPPRYYVFDRGSGTVTHLLDAYPELEAAALSAMLPVRFEARDGLVIPGYLTLPPGISREEARGLPAILLPHGGPTARDVWGWNAEVQFLASRGFAVLQPNFRGSSGYGRAFEEKGYRQWGLAMQDDLTDAARWLIEEGIADPARIGIYGASYGGYAAMMGLAKSPDLFAAGATFAGVSDLVAWLEDVEQYAFTDFNRPVHGDLDGDREQLHRTSPARLAEHVRAPVLVAHGTEDPIVNVDQAHRMIDALEDAGASVEHHLYKGEVHGFLDERNRIHFYERLAAFFERHLAAPRASPDA